MKKDTCDDKIYRWSKPGYVFHVTKSQREAAASLSLLDYFGGKSLITQSHGQSIMSFFEARYQIKGLYLLDEPETALSPRSQLALVNLLSKMSEAGHAQFVIATHSPILLSSPDATIYSFDQVPVGPVRYEETEHYRLFRDFFEDRLKKSR